MKLKLNRNLFAVALILGGLVTGEGALACDPAKGTGQCSHLIDSNKYRPKTELEIYHERLEKVYERNGLDPADIYQQQNTAPDPSIVHGQSDFALALSPSTGAVGIASYSWADVQHNQTMMAGIEDFALASCINKTQNLGTKSYNSKIADKIIRKYGKKSDCRVVKNSNTHENLIAVLRGQNNDGQYALFWKTRENNSRLFSQQQPEFKQLLAQCQSQAKNCEIIGQYGDKTELE